MIDAIRTAVGSRASRSWILACVLVLGCAGLRHEETLAQVQGKVLSASSEDGASRLDIEMSYDAAIRGWVRKSGYPDYLFVRSSKEVALFYIEGPRTVLFTRSVFGSEGAVSVEDAIPLQVAQFFSPEDQRRLKDAEDPER